MFWEPRLSLPRPIYISFLSSPKAALALALLVWGIIFTLHFFFFSLVWDLLNLIPVWMVFESSRSSTAPEQPPSPGWLSLESSKFQFEWRLNLADHPQHQTSQLGSGLQPACSSSSWIPFECRLNQADHPDPWSFQTRLLQMQKHWIPLEPHWSIPLNQMASNGATNGFKRDYRLNQMGF